MSEEYRLGSCELEVFRLRTYMFEGYRLDACELRG